MAKPAEVKVVLRGTTMDVYATNATARARYWIELNDAAPLPPSPDALSKAISLCPPIGSRVDFRPVLGPPVPAVKGGFSSQFWPHQLRLASKSIGSASVKSKEKFFVDCLYESRPMPTVERGCSAMQTKTGTYLATGASGGNSFNFRKQMMLDWIAPAGCFSDGTVAGIEKDPASALPLPRTPVSGSRMEFGDTFRISSTWYGDEITQTQIDRLKWNFATGINSFPLFYIGIPGVDDSRLWLCTSINSVSHDGGYSSRISGEFVFNPAGWDTVSVYELPYSDQPAFLTQEVLAGLSQQLRSGNLEIPGPYLPVHGGAGRWPQQVAVDMKPLIGLLSQGTFLASQPNINELLK